MPFTTPRESASGGPQAVDPTQSPSQHADAPAPHHPPTWAFASLTNETEFVNQKPTDLKPLKLKLKGLSLAPGCQVPLITCVFIMLCSFFLQETPQNCTWPSCPAEAADTTGRENGAVGVHRMYKTESAELHSLGVTLGPPGGGQVLVLPSS